MVKMSYYTEYTDVVVDKHKVPGYRGVPPKKRGRFIPCRGGGTATTYYTDWHDVGEDVRTIELATNVSFIRPNGEVANVDHKDMGNKAIAFHGTSGD